MKYILKPDFEFLKNLDNEQKDAVINSSKHSLIVAGPGSGKTTVITYKIAYLIKSGVKAREILLLTFTKAASYEMIKRAKKISENSLKEMFAGTFHHLGYSMLKKYYNFLNLGKNFTVIDSSDARDIIKSCRKKFMNKSSKKIPSAKTLQKIFSYSCSKLIALKNALLHFSTSYIDLVDAVEEIYKCYTLEKQSQNLVDYDDLLTKTLFLLESYESVRVKESSRFKWILTDEFQDTNYIQYRITDLLSKVHGNLIMVGDDSQSIYSFRGVDIENIKDFLSSKETKIFKIQHNYRSTKRIVEFINHIIPKDSIKKSLVSIREEGNKPIVVETANSFQQARFVSQRIGDLIKDGIKYDEIAILYRSHYQSLETQMELQKNKIPYKIYSGIKFNETAHIKDLIAFMKISINPTEAISWRRILKLFQGIGNVTAENIITSLNENKGEIEKVLEKFTKNKRISKALQRILTFLQYKNTPKLFLEKICDLFYYKYLESVYQNYEDRIMDIKRFIEISEKYEQSDELLADILVSENISNTDFEDGMLTLSTVHQAKGLEWKVVFILSVNPGDLPSYYSIMNEDVSEEERIFYVAVTRAKDQLYILYQNKIDDNFFNLKDYDFISKLPKKIYEKWEVEYDQG